MNDMLGELLFLGMFLVALLYLIYRMLTVEIYEKPNTVMWIVSILVFFLLLAFSIYFGTNWAHYLLGAIIGLIFPVILRTSGITKNGFLYSGFRSDSSGRGILSMPRFVVQATPFEKAEDLRVDKKDNTLEVIFYRSQMMTDVKLERKLVFDRKHENKIYSLLEPYIWSEKEN